MNFKSSSLCKTRCWLQPSLGLALAFLVVFASECRVAGAAPDLSVDRSLQLFHTRDRSCAIAAAYVVLRRFDLSTTLGELGEQLPVSSNGTSMSQIVGFLSQKGLRVDPIDVSAGSLLSMLRSDPNAQAIVLINHNHWVAANVDPQSQFRYYSYPGWHTVGETELNRIADGKVIVVWPPGDKSTLAIEYWLAVAPMGIGLLLFCLSAGSWLRSITNDRLTFADSHNVRRVVR